MKHGKVKKYMYRTEVPQYVTLNDVEIIEESRENHGDTIRKTVVTIQFQRETTMLELAKALQDEDGNYIVTFVCDDESMNGKEIQWDDPE